MEKASLLIDRDPTANATSIQNGKRRSSASSRGSAFSCFVGLASTMMGACILSLPATLVAVGVVPSMLVFVFAAWISYESFQVLCICCDATGEYSYEALSSRLFGSFGVWMIRIFTILLSFGACVMYMVIAMDMFQPLLEGYLSRNTIGFVFTLIAIPLCLPDTIHQLRYTNMLVVACIWYIVAALMYRTLQKERGEVFQLSANAQQERNIAQAAHFNYEIPALAYAIPIVILSFGCQLNVPRAYYEIDDKSQMQTVNRSMSMLALVFYAAFALLGFACFHGNPPSDILSGFAADDKIINAARVCLGVSALLKTPMAFQPMAQLLELCCLGRSRRNFAFRVVLTVVLLLLAELLSATAHDLGLVISYLGSVGGMIMSTAAPGMFLWEVTRGFYPGEQDIYSSNWLRFRAVFLTSAGLLLSFSSLVYLIVNAL